MAKTSAAYYEVRWRLKDTDEAWSAPQSVNPASEVVVEGLDRTKAYEFEVRAVSSCGAKSDWVSGDHTVPGAPAGTLTLPDLKSEVDSAASDAAAANAALADIASDNMLTAGEKPIVIRDYNVITTEQAGIDAQATAYGITTEKAAYDTKVTALTTYLGTLTTPTLWNDLSGNTTIVGADFRQAFADVYTSRQALLNAIYAAAKAKADAAQASADQASANVPAVINGQFKNGTTGWTFDNPTGFYQNGTDGNSPDSACPTHLVRQGQAGGATTYARNTGYVAVQKGQVVTAAACLKALSANAGAYAGTRISWRDASHAELSATLATVTVGPGGAYLQAVSRAVGQAPPNAQFAHFEIFYVGHSSGYINATSCNMGSQLASQDELPDGSTFRRVSVAQASGINVVENGAFGTPASASEGTGTPFSRWCVFANTNNWWSFVTNSNTADPLSIRLAPSVGIVNGATVSGWVANGPNSSNTFTCNGNESFLLGGTSEIFAPGGWPAGVTASATIAVAWFDRAGGFISNSFGSSITQSAGVADRSSVVQAPSNAAFGAIQLKADVTNSSGTGFIAPTSAMYFNFGSVYCRRIPDLGTEAVGTLSTQRRLPLVTWGNYGGGWNGLSVTYTTTTTSASFSASAASFVGGGDSIAYNASSVTVSGSPGATATYYFYYDDPGMTGGSKSLQATTNQITSLNANGRVFVGQATITYPTSGTGSGGGQTGCPQVDEPVIRRAPDGSHETIRAGDVRVGDDLLLASGRWGRVSYSEARLQPGVRVVGLDGSSITCSESAPLETAEGPCVPAPFTAGLMLKHRRAGVMRVAEVFDAGEILVQHITCENDCFWVGDYSHHNMKPAK